jgi:hypothetical protein
MRSLSVPYQPPSARSHSYSDRIAFTIVMFALWLAVVAFGFYIMARYDTTPGEARPAPVFWPQGSAIKPASAGWNLVLFIHPQCPCSRASLDELNVIMNSNPARAASAQVVFLKPSDRSDDWVHTSSWQQAGAIQHASRWLDAQGAEAARFGARTSGFLLVYDPKGQLRFSGGITGARGEDGDNLGREAVLQLLAGKPDALSTHAVFGCRLMGSAQPEATGQP